jgi:hypothetical protein
VSLLLAAAVAASAIPAAAEEVVLFNGRNLTGWEASFGSFGPGGGTPRKVEDTWTVQDGAIMCRGGQRNGGWLHTTRSFTNYELHLEFRWGEIDPAVKAAGGNIYTSGLFLRSNPGTMPGGGHSMMTYQAQIIHTPARASGENGGGTGDLWLISYDDPNFQGANPNIARINPSRPMPPGISPARDFPRLKFAEKPIGEWNTYEIRADHDKLTYTLNGEVVNRGTGAGLHPGKIGLECENTPIFFRNIRVNMLP